MAVRDRLAQPVQAAVDGGAAAFDQAVGVKAHQGARRDLQRGHFAFGVPGGADERPGGMLARCAGCPGDAMTGG